MPRTPPTTSDAVRRECWNARRIMSSDMTTGGIDWRARYEQTGHDIRRLTHCSGRGPSECRSSRTPESKFDENGMGHEVGVVFTAGARKRGC